MKELVNHLIHCTSPDTIPLIKSEGLKRIENNSETQLINFVLEECKPASIPDWISRADCIFFYPSLKSWFAEGIAIGKWLGVKVNINDIDLDLLYVADDIYVHRISYLVDVFEDMVKDNLIFETKTKENLRENLIKMAAKNYWKSLKPYKEYCKYPMLENCEIELLYFGDLTPITPVEYITKNNFHKYLTKLIIYGDKVEESRLIYLSH